MKKDDLLGLFLRCLGAWEGVSGIAALSTFIFAPLGAIAGIPRIVTGLVLFFGAGYLVELTYGPRYAEDMQQS